MKSTIKLFKAIPIKGKGRKDNTKILLETIKRGFIFSPEVIYNYSGSQLKNLISMVEDEYGITGEQANATFHKSWEKVKTASMLQLVIEQIMHYITTYGFERLGIYNKDSIYIPYEVLEIPPLDIDGFHFIVIKGLTKDELKERLMTFLRSGIALKEDTKNAVVDVALFTEITGDEILKISNKEVRCTLYDFLDKIPEQPIEFLRYVIYKSIGSTLLIKDKATLEGIRANENFDALALFYKYKQKYGLERLAEIFYRFKEIFVAFKTNAQLSSIINKTRKLAKKYHKPMKEDYLNSVTSMIKNDVAIDAKTLNSKLDSVNIFRKIRLAYALHHRANYTEESILYKIRNGKGFAKEFRFENRSEASSILSIVLNSIIGDVSKNVRGKTIYIPDYVTYALPATEKQFVGDFPSGTCITTPKEMVAGVHWFNTKRRIDLDLSLTSMGMKLGWDASYRDSERNTMFSGDITDAPKSRGGASELFYINANQTNAYLMLINYYNFEENSPVPFKIMVGKYEGSLKRNHMINPNHILAISKTMIDKKEKALGLVIAKDGKCQFFFNEANLGRRITSSDKPYVEHTRKYLVDYCTNMISLNSMLSVAGAKIITKKPIDDKIEYTDLSPESIDKETIIGLITNH